MHVPLVFVTKYRRGVFDDEILTRCEEITRKVCKDFDAELKEFNGERDHVHLPVHYPPKFAVSKLVNSLKCVSARRIRQEFTGRINRSVMHGHLWSPSYFSASAAEHRWRSSASTSNSKNVRSNMHLRTVLRCIHPRRERRGFLQESR
ncbi:hypothetical protein GCM10010350_39780 [Streptomyces galilaeus]|nr:hypothetical protein GCM10010350_39780 [Streptomyces galilaeus]